MSQMERDKGMSRRGGSSLSSWGDGLVSLSFASRLKLRQDKPTEPHPQEAQSQKQRPNQGQHAQMHGHPRRQK